MVYFDRDDVAPNATARVVLDYAVSLANQCNIDAVLVVGHTDTVGAADANQRISEVRAAAVRDVLIERGIPAGVIRTEGRGETDLAQPTLDEVSEPLNRRVQITISFR